MRNLKSLSLSFLKTLPIEPPKLLHKINQMAFRTHLTSIHNMYYEAKSVYSFWQITNEFCTLTISSSILESFHKIYTRHYSNNKQIVRHFNKQLALMNCQFVNMSSTSNQLDYFYQYCNLLLHYGAD